MFKYGLEVSFEKSYSIAHIFYTLPPEVHAVAAASLPRKSTRISNWSNYPHPTEALPGDTVSFSRQVSQVQARVSLRVKSPVVCGGTLTQF